MTWPLIFFVAGIGGGSVALWWIGVHWHCTPEACAGRSRRCPERPSSAWQIGGGRWF